MSSDREAIVGLMHAYAEHSDACRFREWAELFAPDGGLEAFGRRFEGHERLQRFISKAALGQHSFDLGEILVEGDRARARSTFRFVANDPSFHSRGTYHDELVRRDGTWLFATRRIEFAARGPDALDA
jgi:hypothetical protein